MANPDDTASDDDASLVATCQRIAVLASQEGRDDLVEPLRAALARLRRPGTVVCVVGEFKQGKSSLVNALLGEQACPVDDDLATSVVTVVHHQARARAVVRRAPREDEDQASATVVEVVELPDVRNWVTESGNPGNERQLERLDLGLPNDLLATGLTLVDTPGAGTADLGLTAATMGFLPLSDGLLFVTDASQELTRPELDLLAEATARCSLVICVMTKVDLHPHWRQILELNRGHLAAAGLDVPIVTVSAELAMQAEAEPPTGDVDLTTESGLAQLLAAIETDVVDRATAIAATGAVAMGQATIDQLLRTLEAETAVLRDPSTAAALEEQIAEAKARLAHLRGPGAAWRSVLTDHVQDLSASTTQQLRRITRQISRAVDDEVGDLRTQEDWERISKDLQARVAAAIAELFASVEMAGETIRDELAGLLDADDVDLPRWEHHGAGDLTELWGARDVETHAAGLGDGMQAMRGAQSGVLMFGMMGRMLPAAASALIASNPVMLGAGLLLGGKALRDQRDRRMAQQRKDASTAIRRFVDDVQFELGPQLQDAVKGLQRELRDAVASEIARLLETWADTGRKAQAALQASTTEREARLRELEPRLVEIRALRADLTAEAATS